jgi:uncharacterized protein (DUF1800 family)
MTQFTRRHFLQFIALGTVAAGCTPIVDNRLQPALPAAVNQIRTETATRIVHLLNRATFGATSGLVETANNQGIEAWLEQQFDYQALDDWQMALRLRRLDTLNMTAPDLLSFGRLPDKHYVANQLAAAMLLQAIYSKRQLYEMLVHFWGDHFSIYHFKADTYTLKTVDDREVIRPHALGNFGAMLRASAHSPAMLFYLDNIVNEKSHPNENYAREIMELHTLGVDGGYTENDVLEVARCFTGWSVSDNGRFEYRPEWHDDGEKQVLGHTIAAGGGKSDGDHVLEILIEHPSTARYLATKLARRFVADEPSAPLVDDLTTTWRESHGDIITVMRRLFQHELFWNAPQKFKRPLELVISLLRVTNATYNGSPALVERLQTMGQRPFGFSTPDGYPDTANEWSGSLTPRWNFALDVVNNNQAGVTVPIQEWLRFGGNDPINTLGQAMLQRDLTVAETQAISSVIGKSDGFNQNDTRTMLAMLLSSPAFQWR